MWLRKTLPNSRLQQMWICFLLLLIFCICVISIIRSSISLCKLLQDLDTNPCRASFNTKNDYAGIAVIVESRSSPVMITIVLNVMQHIPVSWPIQIFHGIKNKAYLQNSSLSEFIKCGRVILTQYREYDGRRVGFQDDYLTNISFWQQVRGEKILIFHIDSIMCSNSPHKITDYLHYDYIGAPWPDWLGYPKFGGSGAFSLRSRNKTITLLQRRKYPLNGGTTEDLWYSGYLQSVGALLAPVHIAKTFAAEGLYYESPMAVHKFYMKNKTEMKMICQMCPEAKLIPPYCN